MPFASSSSRRDHLNIVIYDTTSPRPYSTNTLDDDPIGGTEATVIRVAEMLDALVIQHSRFEDAGRYRAPCVALPNPTHVITLRDPLAAIELSKRFPRSRHFLWLHDLCDRRTQRGLELARHSTLLAERDISIVCVSQYHANQVRTTLKHVAPDMLKVSHIYNPVDVTCHSSVQRDPNKIVFFSSPHKGLSHTIRVLEYLRYDNPKLTLYLANPGYNPSISTTIDGIVNLGSLPHKAMMHHVQSAFCTFYPNFVYPETFGLVMAESNALGTPVLTHPIGAATEVLQNAEQFIPIPWSDVWTERVLRRVFKQSAPSYPIFAKLGLFRCYREKLTAWQRDGPPAVMGKGEFACSEVAAAWRRMLT
jgi:glycosyltransferase involved in cell wall biosynthesis